MCANYIIYYTYTSIYNIHVVHVMPCKEYIYMCIYYIINRTADTFDFMNDNKNNNSIKMI